MLFFLFYLCCKMHSSLMRGTSYGPRLLLKLQTALEPLKSLSPTYVTYLKLCWSDLDHRYTAGYSSTGGSSFLQAIWTIIHRTKVNHVFYVQLNDEANTDVRLVFPCHSGAVEANFNVPLLISPVM